MTTRAPTPPSSLGHPMRGSRSQCHTFGPSRKWEMTLWTKFKHSSPVVSHGQGAIGPSDWRGHPALEGSGCLLFGPPGRNWWRTEGGTQLSFCSFCTPVKAEVGPLRACQTLLGADSGGSTWQETPVRSVLVGSLLREAPA